MPQGVANLKREFQEGWGINGSTILFFLTERNFDVFSVVFSRSIFCLKSSETEPSVNFHPPPSVVLPPYFFPLHLEPYVTGFTERSAKILSNISLKRIYV
jgi:hypothetical protein